MLDIEEFRIKYQEYLDQKVKMHEENFLKLKEENRKDESVFEKIKETTIKTMINAVFNITANICLQHKNNSENIKDINKNLWKTWNDKFGKCNSFEEKLYKIWLYYWIKEFKDESKLKKSEEYNNQEVYMKEKSKHDAIDESVEIFIKMAQEYLPYDETWEMTK